MNFLALIESVYKKVPEPYQEPVQIVIDTSIEMAPLLSQIYHGFQHRKINRALKDMSHKLEYLSNKLEGMENFETFKEEIFPMIIKKLLDEPQEEKIKINIDGIEYLVDNEILDTEIVFTFYDLLEDLRIAELVYLVKNYAPKSPYNLNVNLGPVQNDFNLPQSERIELENRREERRDIERYIINKLFRYGLLVEDNSRYTFVSKEKNGYLNGGESKKYMLSPFGNRFLNFFKLSGQE